MFDWLLNTSMQADTLVNMWKDNIGSLQPTRCNEVWNRISPRIQSPGVQTMRPEPSFSDMSELVTV